MSSECKRRVCVLVVGDIARSPRMCYHAESLATSGHAVSLVGHVTGGASRLSVSRFSDVHALPPVPTVTERLPALIGYAVRTVWNAVCLLWLLLVTVPAYSVLLVQNPPGVPALAVGWLACRIRRARLIIDWHNYTHSVLALSSPSASGDSGQCGARSAGVLVRVARWLEFKCGRHADAGLCVTDAMRSDLKQRWNVANVYTLHDRPASRFRPISSAETHALFERLSCGEELFSCLASWLDDSGTDSIVHDNKRDTGDPDYTGNPALSSNVFTELLADGSVCSRETRPGLLVSSTSWTADEDFSVLERALDVYNSARRDNPAGLPRLVCVITGRGPLQRFYMGRMNEHGWRHVRVLTAWLPEGDYAELLASADLGVSLHTSASGLDLPMKVVDMMGAGLPVCALNFGCLSELVRHDQNGLVFGSAEQFSQQLIDWFTCFPASLSGSSPEALRRSRLQTNIDKFRAHGWNDNWNRVALPLFQ